MVDIETTSCSSWTGGGGGSVGLERRRRRREVLESSRGRSSGSGGGDSGRGGRRRGGESVGRTNWVRCRRSLRGDEERGRWAVGGKKETKEIRRSQFQRRTKGNGIGGEGRRSELLGNLDSLGGGKVSKLGSQGSRGSESIRGRGGGFGEESSSWGGFSRGGSDSVGGE